MSKEKSKTKKEEKHKPKKENDSKTKKEENHKPKKENDSKTKKEDDPNDNDLNKFDRLVERNKASGRPWYYGLEGKWWWGMTERGSRKHIESGQILKDGPNTVTTPIVQNKEETPIVQNKEETPIVQNKEETPEIKKEETPEIKKEETPEIKKEETPEIK